jgi:di/tricarboxylate transporter
LLSAAAWAGFSNTGVITVAVMFIIAKCIEVSGTIDWVTRKSLGLPKNRIWAQFRYLTPTVIVSIFTPNTPLVAAMIPVTMSWTTRIKKSPAQFMVTSGCQ